MRETGRSKKNNVGGVIGGGGNLFGNVTVRHLGVGVGGLVSTVDSLVTHGSHTPYSL